MKLTDFDKNTYADQALKETYKIDFDVSNMTLPNTRAMLNKVRSLAMEAKQQSDAYQNNPSYMKLVFMEEALVKHYNDLATSRPRIVVENEEVDKSQVVLAAQDMVDSVQKMIEEVSDMLVKELPALTDSIQSEIGVNESSSFNQAATQALSNLNSTLGQSKTELQGALNTLTGVDAGAAFAPPEAGGEMPVTDVGAAGEVTAPELPAPELPAEEPEELPVGGVGRAKR